MDHKTVNSASYRALCRQRKIFNIFLDLFFRHISRVKLYRRLIAVVISVCEVSAIHINGKKFYSDLALIHMDKI